MTPLKEVENSLHSTVIHDPQYKAFREKTTKLTVLGLRLPIMHEIERREFKWYVNDKNVMLDQWTRIWNQSNVHEVLTMPLFYYRRHSDKLDDTHWRIMKSWIERVENWEHADALCALFSILFERYPKLVEPTLRQWNRSKNPWKRRVSVVSTIYYASKKRMAPPIKIALSLIEPLLRDSDPYVQKGVGWQLREAYKLWPREILKFLEVHVLELPSITFSYATEKLSPKDKQRLKHKRTLWRKRS